MSGERVNVPDEAAARRDLPNRKKPERLAAVAAFEAWQRSRDPVSFAPLSGGSDIESRQRGMVMTTPAMKNDTPRVLSADAFAFELDAELRRAARVRSRVTLVVMEPSRTGDAPVPAVPDTVVQEVADMIGTGVRDTDLLGYTERGTLSLALLDSDFERSLHVIDRLIARMENEPSATTVRIAVGAACYPSHAIDIESLKREAVSRHVANCRGGIGASAS
jgi:hypothetical protein